MDKKTFTIGILSVTALILFVANLIAPRTPAMGMNTIKDRDYTAVTGRTARAGEALYLTDNRTGMMAVVAFNPGRKRLEVIDVKAVANAFAGGGGAANDNGGGGRNGKNR